MSNEVPSPEERKDIRDDLLVELANYMPPQFYKLREAGCINDNTWEKLNNAQGFHIINITGLIMADTVLEG
jgi:hypothetical protein